MLKFSVTVIITLESFVTDAVTIVFVLYCYRHQILHVSLLQKLISGNVSDFFSDCVVSSVAARLFLDHRY